ncbi:MAG: hypothetical protein K6A40_11085 [Solobacterium sp.]|nr:hypothetical protein [Solobacterium sp.]
MIVRILENGTGRDVIITSASGQTELLGSRITFSLFHDAWLIRCANGIDISDHSPVKENRELTAFTEDGREAVLQIFPEAEGYACYERYSAEGPVFLTAGGSGTVLLSECQSEEYLFCFDSKTMTVNIQTDGITCGGKLVRGNIPAESGECLQYGLLKLILFPSFLSVNRIRNVQIFLKPFIKNICGRLPDQDLYRFARDYRQFASSRLDLRLRDYSDEEAHDIRPPIYSAGPQISLSAVMLSAGLLNGWRYYTEGRTVIEILPSLLIPFAFFVSLLIWTPLQNRYEKKRALSMQKKKENAFLEDISRCREQIRSFYEAYTEKTDAMIPSLNELCRSLSVHDTLYHQRTDGLYLRAGNGVCRSLNIETGRITTSSETIHSSLSGLHQYAETVRIPYVYALAEYRCIKASGSTSYIFYLLMQMILFHDPQVFQYALFTDTQTLENNRWLLQIGHLRSNTERRIFLNEERDQISSDIIRIHLKIDSGTSVIEICREQDQPGLILCETDGKIEVTDYRNNQKYDLEEQHNSCFCMPLIMQGIRLVHFENTEKIIHFSDLHDYTDPEKIRENWQRNSVSEGIQALIGTDGNKPLILDLHEKGNGPHGLIAGTTGSGKTELLLTMILSLSLRYSPQSLQFIIIDFKGGGLLNTLQKKNCVLPHLAGRLTDLEENDRIRVISFLRLECQRREKLLQQMSIEAEKGISDVSAYRRCLPYHPAFEEISELVILVDEFAQLKNECAEFLHQLISISRIGRSLGIHLILSTQKPGGIVTDQIWANSRFKICMKVMEEQDSLEVLRSREAASLKYPGELILLCDDLCQKGRAFYTGGQKEGQKMSVELLDEKLQAVFCAKENRPNETESEMIMKNLYEAAGRREYRSLWPQALNVLYADDMPFVPYRIGVIDDYERNRYEDLQADGALRVSLVLAGREEERRRFTGSLRAVLERSMKQEDLYAEDLDSFGTSASKRILMISDSTEFFSKPQQCDDLCEIISRGNAEDSFWIITAYAGSVPYRIRNCADRLLVLSGTSVSEAMTFLQIHHPVRLPHKAGGIVSDGRIREFRYLLAGGTEKDGS